MHRLQYFYFNHNYNSWQYCLIIKLYT